MARTLQFRRDTAANWTSVDPVLAQGELGFEYDTSKFKIGDGSAAWSALPYYGGAGAAITALSALTPAADRIPYFTSGSAAALATATSYGRSLLAVADESALKALINAEGGVDFATQSALTTGLARRMPVGTVVDFAGSSAPAGWLFCFGQAVSRTTYADLFTAIGTTYGVGDGSTTFNLPDLRGRVTAGKDDMGGSSANRLTSPINGDTLGAAGGSESHTLTTAELAVHSHANSLTDPGHVHSYTRYSSTETRQSGGASGQLWRDTSAQNTASSLTGITINNANAGSGNAHNNMQPTLILNKIIFTDV